MSYAAWSVVFGEQPSAAKWNILGTNDASFNDGTGIANLEIGSGKTSLQNDHKFSVYRNAAWTTAGGGAVAKVQFDAESFDTGSNYDAVTNFRFTAPVSGFYFFSTGIYLGSTVVGHTSIVYLYKNGSLAKILYYFAHGTSAGLSPVAGGSGLLQLSASDYVEVYAGGDGNAGGTGTTQTWFDGYLVSQT